MKRGVGRLAAEGELWNSGPAYASGSGKGDDEDDTFVEIGIFEGVIGV